MFRIRTESSELAHLARILISLRHFCSNSESDPPELALRSYVDFVRIGQ